MGPITYSLCQKAIIGPAMWIVGLCSFPPLIDEISLPINTTGASVKTSFSAPVDKNYQFILNFEFASTEARLQDTLVGQRFQKACDTAPASLLGKSEYGHPIPIRILIRRANDQSVLLDQEFTSLCVLGHANNRKSRSVGWVTLDRGEYIAEITNVAAQEGFTDTEVFVALVPGVGK